MCGTTKEVLTSGWSFEKTVITSGTSETTPTDRVKCRITLSDMDERMTDLLTNSRLLNEGLFTVGDVDSDITDVLDICLSSMTHGEVSSIVIRDNSDPPCVFNFNVCLEEFDITPAFHELSSEDKLSNAFHFKEKGTELFKRGNIEFAFKHYSRALKYFICADHLDEEQIGAMISCYLNLAACQLKYQNYPHVITNCTKALALDDNNVKGLYRRANAYANLNMLDEAIRDYSAIKQAEPNNKQVQRELNVVIQKRKKQDETLASRLKGMFT